MDMESLLIMPVQRSVLHAARSFSCRSHLTRVVWGCTPSRLPRYILLLQTMRKRTPPGSEDEVALGDACTRISSVLEQINLAMDKQEQQRLHLVRGIIDSVQGDSDVRRVSSWCQSGPSIVTFSCRA